MDMCLLHDNVIVSALFGMRYAARNCEHDWRASNSSTLLLAWLSFGRFSLLSSFSFFFVWMSCVCVYIEKHTNKRLKLIDDGYVYRFRYFLFICFSKYMIQLWIRWALHYQQRHFSHTPFDIPFDKLNREKATTHNIQKYSFWFILNDMCSMRINVDNDEDDNEKNYMFI